MAYVALTFEEMDSPQWKSLRNNEKAVYLLFRRHCDWETGKMKASYSFIGMGCRVGKRQAIRIMRSLQKEGRIQLVKSGVWHWQNEWQVKNLCDDKNYTPKLTSSFSGSEVSEMSLRGDKKDALEVSEMSPKTLHTTSPSSVMGEGTSEEGSPPAPATPKIVGTTSGVAARKVDGAIGQFLYKCGIRGEALQELSSRGAPLALHQSAWLAVLKAYKRPTPPRKSKPAYYMGVFNNKFIEWANALQHGRDLTATPQQGRGGNAAGTRSLGPRGDSLDPEHGAEAKRRATSLPDPSETPTPPGFWKKQQITVAATRLGDVLPPPPAF